MFTIDTFNLGSPLGEKSGLVAAADSLKERLGEANRRNDRGRLVRLERADEALDRVRMHLRLAFRWGWLTGGQFRHVAQIAPENGRAASGYRIRPLA